MKCIIVDDEPLAHQVLGHYIAETPGLSLLASFRNAVEAFEYLGKNQVDLLFLDIEMPLVNGIHFLKALPNPPQTIFTTAYKQYAFESYELHAIDYLLKPFSYERFMMAVQKANKKPELTPDHIGSNLLIKDKQTLLNIKQQEILYIEGCKDYVNIVTANQSYLVYQTLKGVLEELNPAFFLQAQRSYIINKTHVDRIVQNKLIMTNKFIISIGPLYKKELIEFIKR